MNNSYKLKFDLQSRSNRRWYYAKYSTFRVLPESSNYRLQVSGYSGNAGYDAFIYSNGMMFTTFDRDNDLHKDPKNCATIAGGGFWHKVCANSEVNSVREPVGPYVDEFSWDNMAGGRPLQSTRMWLQCY